MRVRGMTIGVLALWACGCVPTPDCPDGWSAKGEGEEIQCTPPEGHAEEVASRLGTSFFGYGLIARRAPDGDDACTYRVEELARNRRFNVTIVDPPAGSRG